MKKKSAIRDTTENISERHITSDTPANSGTKVKVDKHWAGSLSHFSMQYRQIIHTSKLLNQHWYDDDVDMTKLKIQLSPLSRFLKTLGKTKLINIKHNLLSSLYFYVTEVHDYRL